MQKPLALYEQRNCDSETLFKHEVFQTKNTKKCDRFAGKNINTTHIRRKIRQERSQNANKIANQILQL